MARIESVTTMNLEGLEQRPDGAMFTFMASTKPLDGLDKEDL